MEINKLDDIYFIVISSNVSTLTKKVSLNVHFEQIEIEGSI